MSFGATAACLLGGRRRPATAANRARNALGGGSDRADRWMFARDAAWRLLEGRVSWDARVAVLGAGNGHDLPLGRLAAMAGEVDLFDIDLPALRRARRACAPEVRQRIRVRRCDVTAGAADRIAYAVSVGRQPRRASVPLTSIGEGGYDVVIGDLLYSQLLYPALLDGGVPPNKTAAALAAHGPALTDIVVARMHASAADGGQIIHLHDMVGWWEDHAQPVSLEAILAEERLEDAFALMSSCRQPVGTDPRASALRLGAPLLETVLWEWPFAPDARYLVCATVTERGEW
jgi:hypothetical protein